MSENIVYSKTLSKGTSRCILLISASQLKIKQSGTGAALTTSSQASTHCQRKKGAQYYNDLWYLFHTKCNQKVTQPWAGGIAQPDQCNISPQALWCKVFRCARHIYLCHLHIASIIRLVIIFTIESTHCVIPLAIFIPILESKNAPKLRNTD